MYKKIIPAIILAPPALYAVLHGQEYAGESLKLAWDSAKVGLFANLGTAFGTALGGFGGAVYAQTKSNVPLKDMDGFLEAMVGAGIGAASGLAIGFAVSASNVSEANVNEMLLNPPEYSEMQISID